ncbi:AbrB/MazE/SpoVT family DNA-binding domain-containing protein [Patescibacteria group bacterium]|nr:AbrB/MazE/SpoVT family DNA-binding domain-containing protein [Patescibacteria group bacterium]MBU4098360.1 AbrB/MazE/SpoVT family DNA-binding domain-containing protein [Patescibacteria group bacterium]
MQFITSVTQKGQATIPAVIRRKLGIKTNSKIVFEVNNNEVSIKPVVDFFSLKGSIKSSKPFDIDAMEKAVTDAILVKYVKKSN